MYEFDYSDGCKSEEPGQDSDNLIAIFDLSTERIEYISQGLKVFLGCAPNDMTPSIEEFFPDWRDSVTGSGLEADSWVKFPKNIISIKRNGRIAEVDINLVNGPLGNHLVLVVNEANTISAQDAVLEQVFFSSQYAVALIDRDFNCIGINSHFTELFNYTFDEIHGKSIKLIAPDALAREMESNFSAINSGKIVKSRGLRLPKGGLPIELDILGYPIVHGNRVESTFMLYVRPSYKNRHPGYTSLLSAVGNEYVRENPPVHAPVIDLKTTDWLTGFYSRTTFIETLEQTVERVKNVGGKLALMAIDIENFKEINDSLGHVTGDEILASLGRRISAVIPNDSLVSRFNGDDYFVSFLFDDYDEVKKIAGDILEMSEAPYDIGHSSVHLKVNIGVCYIPDHATDVQTAIRYANIAEYRTTKQGNERISFYSEEMSAEIEDNFYITNFLMEAIERNELSMHYQPIIDLTTDKIIGVEALMRWKNKVLGDVSPDRFIPVAEKSGKIYEMGEWALEEVCRQIMHWKSRNIDNIHVSVNASIKQLEKRDFAERCIGLIDKYGVDARSIEIEITESVSTGDVASIVRNLRGLKQKGFSIAMDDFGTGFSSLGQLEVFELDKLKIDKIFVDGMVSDPRKQNLVKAIIAMAGSLNLQVVAEGIEEKEQLEYLKRFGCELGQGYLFSRPLQKDRFEAFYWKFEC